MQIPAMATPGSKVYGQIVLFGDSITEWSSNPSPGFSFQPALQHLYNRKLDVVNRGFSGYNTQHALHALPQFMPGPEQARVRLMFVFFGANDSATPENPSRQHVPLEEYKRNLGRLVAHPAVLAHDVRVVLVVPPPVDEALMEEIGFGENGRLARVTARYAEGCREVARETKVACCDLWTVFMKYACKGGEIPDPLPGDKRAPVNERLRELLADGLHFKPKAYELMFGAVRETILENFPELDPDKMPPVLPLWADAPKMKAEHSL